MSAVSKHASLLYGGKNYCREKIYISDPCRVKIL
jgi:hypothetical protein